MAERGKQHLEKICSSVDALDEDEQYKPVIPALLEGGLRSHEPGTL
jgi:hypothetical protein